MVKGYKNLISEYFDKHSFVESNIKSFNNFLDRGMQKIITENNEIIPTIIPQHVENFKIKFDKVWVDKPIIVEADGSRRPVFPMESRLRSLSYASTINLEVSALVNDIQRENFVSDIGKIPIMLKSKYCHLNNLNREDLIKKGEDPDDVGGYFILNGNERVLITVEDLASNKLFIKEEKTGPSKFSARVFSERSGFRIPTSIERLKDGIIYLSFTRFNRVPIVVVIKALGLVKDQEIMQFISGEFNDDDVMINLYNSADITTQDEAIEYLSRRIGLTQHKELKTERIFEQLDRYLLPHIGMTRKERILKAYNLCKYINRFLLVSREEISLDDKDHYMNKRLKLSGDLLDDLFRVNLKSLIQDILYNFQRLVKRGKFQSLKIIIRDQLLTSRIKSAMATGNWVGGRKGISQNIQRTNQIDTISHLQRVASLLTSTQENFDARALHPTMWGRLCPVETPEGTPIGLRKNLSMLCNITQSDSNEEKIRRSLESAGLKPVY